MWWCRQLQIEVLPPTKEDPEGKKRVVEEEGGAYAGGPGKTKGKSPTRKNLNPVKEEKKVRSAGQSRRPTPGKSGRGGGGGEERKKTRQLTLGLKKKKTRRGGGGGGDLG